MIRASCGCPVATRVMSTSVQKSADGYRVPQRFSIAEILAMMTVFGLLFGGLRVLALPGLVHVSGHASRGDLPGADAVWLRARGASTLVGGVFLPVWVWGLLALG